MLLESCPSPDQDVSVLTFDSLHPTTHADYETGLEGILLELWVFLEFLAPLVSCSKWVCHGLKTGLGSKETTSGDGGAWHPMVWLCPVSSRRL